MTMMATSEPGTFFDTFGGEGNDENAEHTDECREPVDGGDVAEVNNPFRHEVGRNGFGDVQSEQVLDLRGENGDRNTAGKPYDNGVGDELDDGAKAANTQHNEEYTGQHGGNHQSGKT